MYPYVNYQYIKWFVFWVSSTWHYCSSVHIRNISCTPVWYQVDNWSLNNVVLLKIGVEYASVVTLPKITRQYRRVFLFFHLVNYKYWVSSTWYSPSFLFSSLLRDVALDVLLASNAIIRLVHSVLVVITLFIYSGRSHIFQNFLFHIGQCKSSCVLCRVCCNY